MNGKAKWVSGWLLIALLPLLAGAAAQEGPIEPGRPSRQGQTMTDDLDHPTDHETVAVEARSSLKKANELIGAKVVNDNGQDLGTIEDIVLNPRHDAVSYAVLARGGFLGWGGKFFAVPWSEFEYKPQENRLVLSNVTPEHLENAKGFDKSNWPTMASPNWLGRNVDADRDLPDSPPADSLGTSMPRNNDGVATDTRTYQDTPDRERIVPRSEGDEPRAPAERTAAAKADLKYRKLSELVGLTIKNEQGEELGELENIILDTHEGTVAYAVLSMRRGFLGLNKDYVPVPWSSLNILPNMGTARMNADKQTLEAIAFDSEEFPNLEDREYSRELHERFGARPYWEALGFVPGEEGRRSGASPWKEGSEYDSLYQPGELKTIHGTIESVGTFRPDGTAVEGLRLRIKTEDGKSVTVHAGPKPYVERQDIAFHYGDRVTVTGSPGNLDWRDVIIASQIKLGDKTLNLRNEEGKPRWDADDLEKGRQ